MIIPRSQWTASIPKSNVGAEDTQGTPYLRHQEVTGISFLTPGEAVLFVELSPYQYLETYRKRNFAQDGFGDISWNLGVSQNVKGIFSLRGLCNKPASHKDKKNNSTNVSVLVMLGNEEPPTDLLLDNLRACRNFVLSKFPNATEGMTNLPFKDFWEETVEPEHNVPCQLPEAYTQDPSVQVHELIEHLAYWNYYRARNDGVYGPVTTNAVMELQADLSPDYYRKRVDGIYGRYTREAFCRYLKEVQVK